MIRRDPAFAATKVLMMTARGGEVERRRRDRGGSSGRSRNPSSPAA
ncbi:MAG: hypothetical protein AAFW69_07495 [Pseudomonadota bacterium]